MKRIITLALFVLSPGWAIIQGSQINLEVSVAAGELRSFYVAVGDYYGIPHREVIGVRERYRLPDEELPVVFFLAARARVGPSIILDLRMGGMSWLDISFRYGLTPDIFFVPLAIARIGPPYGNAYGLYKKYGPAREWKRFVLSDHEIVDLVNLRFVSEHHKIPPETVIKMRSRGQSFVNINGQGGIANGQEKGRNGKDRKGTSTKGKGKRK